MYAQNSCTGSTPRQAAATGSATRVRQQYYCPAACAVPGTAGHKHLPSPPASAPAAAVQLPTDPCGAGLEPWTASSQAAPYSTGCAVQYRTVPPKSSALRASRRQQALRPGRRGLALSRQQRVHLAGLAAGVQEALAWQRALAAQHQPHLGSQGRGASGDGGREGAASAGLQRAHGTAAMVMVAWSRATRRLRGRVAAAAG